MTAAQNTVAYVYENVGIGEPTLAVRQRATAYAYEFVVPPAPVTTKEAAQYIYINSTAPSDPVPADGSELPIWFGTWPEVDEAAIVIPYADGERSDSAVLLADGRVLYVFADVLDPGPPADMTYIKQGYAPDLDTFLTQSGSVTDITNIIGPTTASSACAFITPGGELMLITNGKTAPGVEGEYGTYCWVSPSGLGGDWVIRGKIQDATSNWAIRSTTYEWSIGQPMFVGSRMVLSANVWKDGGIKWMGIWTSDDGGYSWTKRLEFGYYIIGGPYGETQSRNFGEYNGVLYWVATGDPGTDQKHWSSSDGGITWTQVDVPEGNYNFGVRSNTHMFRIGGAGEVWQTPLPPNMAGPWELIRDYPMYGGNGQIVQKLGPYLAYMHDGKLLALRVLEIPWLRQRQRDDILRLGGQPRNSPKSIQKSIRVGNRNNYL